MKNKDEFMEVEERMKDRLRRMSPGAKADRFIRLYLDVENPPVELTEGFYAVLRRLLPDALDSDAFGALVERELGAKGTYSCIDAR